ncbi:MAG: DUF177 domain-containing protein [Proteobacteria bacterium]|nr:DUF177 domain-containing protein [Pseudomonadota bacterium]
MNEFSRPYALDALRERPVRQRLQADTAERAVLAKRFDILGIDRLEADLKLNRVRAGRAVRVEGRITASLSQACVVTLQPVAQTMDAKFSVVFVPPEDLKPLPVDEDGAIDLDAIDPDEELEEPLPEGALDLGELVAQEFAVALDPYPRAPGASFQPNWGEVLPVAESGAPPEGKIRPFADLKAKLKKEK